MATSGSTTWEMTRDQIIAAAMRKGGALAKGQTPDAQDLSDYTLALNALVAEYQTLGMPLWAREQYSITLITNQKDYVLGVGQTLNTPFPLKIHQGILQNSTSTSRIDVNLISIYDFNLLPQGGTQLSYGQPVNMCYRPDINVGTISVWPIPDATTASEYKLEITYQRPFEDFVSAANTPDFPKEWHNALIYGLAALIADELTLPLPDKQYLVQMAEKHLERALSFGVEEASFYVQPDSRYYNNIGRY